MWPRVGAEPPDQRPEVDHRLAALRGSRRKPVQYQLELLHHAVEANTKIGMQAEQLSIQGTGQVIPEPLQAREQDLLEQLRLKIRDAEFEQSARDHPGGGTRILSAAPCPRRNAGTDQDC